MVIKSRFQITFPNCSIQSWILGSCSGSLPYPDNKAWVDADDPENNYVTYASARLLAKRLAAGLTAHGLRPGDRVLVIAGNSVIYPCVMLAIWMAGAVFTGANPGYLARELAFQLRDSDATMMLVAPEQWGVALEAANIVGMPMENIYQLDNTVPDSKEDNHSHDPQHWLSLLASEEKGQLYEWQEPADPKSAICALNYSSGTTGLPKGVEVTHFNLVANGHSTVALHKLHPEYKQRTERAAALCVLPMFHAFCQGYYISSFPHEGIPVYIMQRFDLLKMLRHIATFRITKFLAVPPIFVAMSKHPIARKADLSSLDMVGSGAAPLAEETRKEVSNLLSSSGEKMIREGWGMTELTCTGLGWDPLTPAEVGVGELMPGCMAKLFDLETGKEISEPGVPGELYISAPALMLGYWRKPEATRQVISVDADGNRWLRTGDIAYVTPKYSAGAIFRIVDRAKELIKVRGFQVSPSELDALLLERPDVADAAVVGVSINGEEAPRAYIVPMPGRPKPSEIEVQGWVKDRVVHYKRLRGGVMFVDAIPKNPAGKILRKVLQERARIEVEKTTARL
ncbi:unnamed protein product [Clonostachys byssicola]|uniref:Uncharacterized protein n=1 Tax=Clonostachys byssicola TaxID=160290 RepID=A0A9N9UNJ2_9HYPO|nr:unnamed protein product [Clonostachys byssicola]